MPTVGPALQGAGTLPGVSSEYDVTGREDT